MNFIPNNYINLEEPASYSKLKYTYMFILLFVKLKLNDSLNDSSLYFICISIHFETSFAFINNYKCLFSVYFDFHC